MAEKEGALVHKGHENVMKYMLSILEQNGLPTGLLPLTEVIEGGFVPSTGYFWVVQQKPVEHRFSVGEMVRYATEVHGYIERCCIKKLRGVRAKKLMLWPPVSEIAVDDPPAGKIYFKSFIGVAIPFPIEPFEGHR